MIRFEHENNHPIDLHFPFIFPIVDHHNSELYFPNPSIHSLPASLEPFLVYQGYATNIIISSKCK